MVHLKSSPFARHIPRNPRKYHFIVDRVKKTLLDYKPSLPDGLQTTFFSAAIQGVLREALIAACLTAFMILLFLGNWKSTLIIAISIPLSILVSVLCLSALGETINIMTLGDWHWRLVS